MEEKICRGCMYYNPISEIGDSGKCQKSPVFIPHYGTDFCGDGYWKKFSELTGEIEEYWFDDEKSYNEERKKEEEKSAYIVFSSKRDKRECEVFDSFYKAKTYRENQEEEEKSTRMFKTFWRETGEYWETSEVKDEG
jgi:hypothetical protein